MHGHGIAGALWSAGRQLGLALWLLAGASLSAHADLFVTVDITGDTAIGGFDGSQLFSPNVFISTDPGAFPYTATFTFDLSELNLTSASVAVSSVGLYSGLVNATFSAFGQSFSISDPAGNLSLVSPAAAGTTLYSQSASNGIASLNVAAVPASGNPIVSGGAAQSFSFAAAPYSGLTRTLFMDGNTDIIANVNSVSYLGPGCSGIINGSVPKPSGGGTTISTTFTPNGRLTLSQAASDCGYTDFEWLQKLTIPAPSPVYAANLQSGTPTNIVGVTNDPPANGGYTYELYTGYPSGDFSYPFYCSGSDFNTGGVCAKTATNFSYRDRPTDPCLPNANGTPSQAWLDTTVMVPGPTGAPTTNQALCSDQLAPVGDALQFKTDLVGVLTPFTPGTDCIALDTCVDTGVGFSWSDTFNGTAGGIAVPKNDVPIDVGSGTGGITILGYSPDASGGTDIPEPPTVLLLALATLTLITVAKKGKTGLFDETKIPTINIGFKHAGAFGRCVFRFANFGRQLWFHDGE